MTVYNNNVITEKKTDIKLFLLLPILSIILFIIGMRGILTNFKIIYLILASIGICGTLITSSYVPKNKRK